MYIRDTIINVDQSSAQFLSGPLPGDRKLPWAGPSWAALLVIIIIIIIIITIMIII